MDINNLIDDLRIFSWEAADTLLYYSKIIKENPNKNDFIKNNDHDNPVTIADLKVNEIIIKRISETYKDINWKILSEENVKKKSSNCDTNSEWLWVLDPLDGTKDFIQGTGNYAMHLALNHKNKPYIGLVLIPEKDEWWISNGTNTWCERRDGSYLENVILNNKSIQGKTIVTSQNHRNQTLNNLIDKINFKEVKTMGSIGCKVASIIKGESDVYITLSLPGQSSPKDWDYAAPEAILKASGGIITNLENEELTYNQKDFNQGGIIIASNEKKTHEELCYYIKDIIRKNNLYPLNR